MNAWMMHLPSTSAESQASNPSPPSPCSSKDVCERVAKGDELAAEADGNEAADKAAQNAVQHAHAGHRGDSHKQSRAHKKPRSLPGFARRNETLR